MSRQVDTDADEYTEPDSDSVLTEDEQQGPMAIAGLLQSTKSKKDMLVDNSPPRGEQSSFPLIYALLFIRPKAHVVSKFLDSLTIDLG